MSADELRAAAAVMVAAADGAEIEWQDRFATGQLRWRAHSAVRGWNWDVYHYRVKPKPREYWLRLTSSGAFAGHYEDKVKLLRDVELHPGSVAVQGWEIY